MPGRIVVLAGCLVLAWALAARAAKSKVYRYRMKDGRVDYGTDVPPGATPLGEVGEVEVKVAPADRAPAATAAGESMADRASGRLEPVLEALARRPLTAGLFAAGLTAWAVLAAWAIPRLVRAYDPTLDDALRIALLSTGGIVALGLWAQVLERLWVVIAWSPRADLGHAVDAAFDVAYALAVVLPFRLRLRVGIVKATLIAALWLLVVAGAAGLVWTLALARPESVAAFDWRR